MRQSRLAVLILAFAIPLPGCTSFSLREQSGVLPIQKQRRASDASLFVAPFAYEPEDPKDADDLTPADLTTWQRLLVAGIDQANVFARVEAAPEGGAPPAGDFVLSGRITRFWFEKNWVPTFFPIHLGLSFFTFTGYTLFGGPTTATVVRFSVEFHLQRADTGEEIVAFDENFRSTRAVNIYSTGAENPYDNPNLVFAQVIGSAATRIAAALP
jgi:hypothetical protein